MGAKLKERMEDLIPRLQRFLSNSAAEFGDIPAAPAGESMVLGIPMNHLMVGRGNNDRRDQMLMDTLNQALKENGFLDHEPIPRVDPPDAPYAFVNVESSRRDTGRLSTRKEVWLRIYTNNQIMLADVFEKIGQRAIELAEATNEKRRRPGDRPDRPLE